MQAMKAVDPTIKIGVVVVTSGENNGYKNWTPVMLARLKVLNAIPDFIIYHKYPQAPGQESDATLLQVGPAWTANAADLRQQLTTNLGASGAGVEIVVTENNLVYSSPGKESTSLVNGLYLADSIASVMKTEINAFMWWGLRNGPPTITNSTTGVTTLDGNMSASLYGWRLYGDYGMISTPSNLTGETTYYNPYPTYYAMKLLQYFARGGDTMVAATSSNNLLAVFAAKRTNGSLSLLIINKDPTNALSASFGLAGHNPAATATVYSYGKPQDDAAKPGGSGLTDVATTTLNIAGANFTASFAPYSLTVLSLDAAAITVAPAITLQPQTQTVTAGAAVTFTTAASGTPAPGFQWQKNSVNLPGATNSSYTIATTVADDAGAYRVIATNSAGAATSNPATLTVNSRPSFTLQPASLTVNAGVSATFTAAATGTPVPTYQWQRNGVNIAGATGSSYTVARALPGDAGSYVVIATNSVGATGSAPANLTVQGSIAGDFSGDGQADILWENVGTGEHGLWVMTGTAPATWINLPSIALDWRIVGTGDFNGDGQTDILWENVGSGDRGLWLMSGTTPAVWINLPSIALDWRIVGTGDFNGDGMTDILWENVGSGDRGLWIMNGTTPVAWINLPSIALDWRIVGTGDFNGDGMTDILWENVGSGDRGLWIMNGTVPVAWINLPSIALDWRITGTGDFNGDGLTDILWENVGSGDRGLWIMSGTVPVAWINLPTLSLDWRIAQ